MITLQPETEQLARLVAARRGTTPEAVVRDGVEAEARAAGVGPIERDPGEPKATIDELMAIAEHCASLPLLDPRTRDEIIGYDENGLPA